MEWRKGYGGESGKNTTLRRSTIRCGNILKWILNK